MPPASAVQGLNLSLQLGTEYERKKQKLLQELQLDYKHYVTKKKDLKTSERHPPPQRLSLPIDENLSEKEKLREERKKEYNLFLQEKAQTRRFKRRTPSINAAPGQIPSPAAPLLPPLNTKANITTPRTGRPASRRDAATLTEAENQGKSRRTWDRRQRRRRRLLLCRPIEPYSSEEEPFTDEEERLEFGERRRKNTDVPELEGKEEKSMRERSDKRAPKEAEAPRVRDQNNNDLVLNSQKPESMKVAVRPSPATSKDTAEFATGLLIGATEEQAASQMRKEQYKQELLKQIAEEQRNKMKEKKLELRVAATGATDPEKKSDRIKQFGAIRQQSGGWRRHDDHPDTFGTDLEAAGKEPDLNKNKKKPSENTEQRASPRKSQVEPTENTAPGSGSGTEAVQSLPSLDYFNEDYHREISNMLREATMPRVAGVPPPVPPTVTNNYTTPYDAAYYYYGARNPLDPNPPQNDLAARVQESVSLHSSPQELPPLKPGHRSEPTDLHRPSSSPLYVSELPVDEAKQRRENALIYQEALRQQIKEREERKRREKQERERYDAKIEAEMTAYNPWGRSGGGAPIKDQKGNLFSDLNQMHRTNKESFKNQVSENCEQTRNLLKTNGNTHEVEGKAAFSHRISALNDPPNPQQHCMQDTYKEALKQQIEENKRLQAEERERMRIEEEKEERRLAEQRIRMQREYEEEQRKQNKIENKTESQSWTNKPQTHRQEEKTVKQEEEPETRAPLIYERESSPPVPALQRKQTNNVASRASSAVSQLSSTTVSRRSVSAPHYPSVPGKTAQLEDGHHEVIRQLSALRRFLRKEQKQLEGQMDKRDGRQLQCTPPNRSRRRRSPAVDAFESERRDTDEPSTAKTYSVAARVDMQNIKEFNQLKYRETASREEVLHMFPDPPTDAQSLDIQQQALREQRRKIRLMRGEEDRDLLDLQLSHYYPRNKPQRRIHKDSILPSETAFIDVYSDDVGEERQKTPQFSTGRQERAPSQRRRDNDISTKERERRDVQADAQSLQSSNSPHSAPEVRGQAQSRRIRRRDSDDHNRKSERLIGGGEEDALSLSSVLEGGRVSVDTVATEPWLRPGTLSAVKRSAWGERPESG
ncbi:hypothetical protein JOB18_022233 [Solea senegalensis]|uniref:Centrosome and spindle pole-associated protein 1 C-terminal domain-containing protein n=1 Tax=Solea senegalensis TaxID=28829 RepID=A0AAV6T6K5_SOLSE|nr:centrosome and spindle pole-associated protein 1 isoform X2 [Solea senegalensis]KAG7525099.1 hypothetical protein JOB18_022233 [Solea senegalensis]